MAVPSPPVALSGGCTEIYDNSLYAYQQDAFQSLDLQAGGNWTQLADGVSVNGARCVLGTQNGQDVLYVVGGVATSGPGSYSGLQRYRFSDKSWQTITFDEPSVLQDRMQHGATFLNESETIVVYAGTQDGNQENTSQTFTISTNSSPVALSYTSNQAPPGAAPILLPWNASHAMMAGGSTSNQQVWTFSPDDGWHQVNVLLPTDLPDMTQVQGSLIQGDNSSKILELFDMTQTPNAVIPLLLSPGDGPAASKRSASHLVSRDVDLTNWPPYNASLAPNNTRSGYSVALASSGLVVISGGTSQDGDAVTIFNQTGNTWVDAAQFFNPTKASTTTAPSAVVPTSSAATSAAAGSGSGGGGGLDSTQRTILGAVLGGVFGLIALAIIILLILRGMRQRQSRKRRGSDFGLAEKRYRFADKPAATGIDREGLSPIPSNSSGASSPMRRHFARGADVDGTDDMVIPIEQQNIPHHPGPRTARSDAGWSQYFPSETSGVPLPAAHSRAAGLKDSRTLGAPGRDTQYTQTSDYSMSTNAHISAEVAPLNLRDSEIPPTTTDDLLESSVSAQDSWDPVSTSEGRSSFNHRPVSSLYEDTAHQPGIMISRFPGVPQSRTASIVTPIDEDRGMRTMAARDLGGRAADALAPSSSGNGNTKSSGSSRPNSGHVDNMSWLKLGGSKR